MFITPSVGSSIATPSKPVHFGAVYRTTNNSEQEIAKVSARLQAKDVFISRFFQGDDRYLAANDKAGPNNYDPGQDASAIAGIFKIRKEDSKKFTDTLKYFVLNKGDQGEIKNLSAIDSHPALSRQKSSIAKVVKPKNRSVHPVNKAKAQNTAPQSMKPTYTKPKYTTVFSDHLETMYDSEGGPEW